MTGREYYSDLPSVQKKEQGNNKERIEMRERDRHSFR